MPEIISREEARAQGLKRYFTGESCLYGHVAKRYVCNRQCLKCSGVDDNSRGYSTGRYSVPEKEQARLEGRKRYFTGKPCTNDHISERFVKDGSCVRCERIRRQIKDKIDVGRARKKRQRQRRAARFNAVGLTQTGKLRRYQMLSPEERRARDRERVAKQRAALRALEELGIQI